MSASTAAASARRRAAVGADPVGAGVAGVAGAFDVMGAPASARGPDSACPAESAALSSATSARPARAAATPARWPMRR